MAKTNTPTVDRTPEEEAERERERDSRRDPVGPDAYQDPGTPGHSQTNDPAMEPQEAAPPR